MDFEKFISILTHLFSLSLSFFPSILFVLIREKKINFSWAKLRCFYFLDYIDLGFPERGSGFQGRGSGSVCVSVVRLLGLLREFAYFWQKIFNCLISRTEDCSGLVSFSCSMKTLHCLLYLAFVASATSLVPFSSSSSVVVFCSGF